MAVNIAEIGTVYDALETKIVGTLTTEYDAGRLKGKEYSEVMTAAISALISSSVMSVLEQPIKDAQVLDMKVKDFVALAESEKERQLKDAQIALASSQVTYENAKITSLGIHDAIDEADSTANIALKGVQKTLIELQQVTEDAKASLTDRQTLGYNDQARVKRAEILNNTVGMFGAGGTAVPADFTATALAAAKAVSTEALIIPVAPVV